MGHVFLTLTCALFLVPMISCSPKAATEPLPLLPRHSPPQPEESISLPALKQSEKIRDRLVFNDPATMKNNSSLPSRDSYDVQEYRLEGRFDWSQSILLAHVEIAFKATGPLNELLIDSKLGEIFSVSDPAQGPLAFEVLKNTNQILVKLARALAEGDSGLIRISYATKPTAEIRRGLAAVNARQGDPVTSRVAFTFSEPTSAPAWMPCHDKPSDRAIFQIRMKMPFNDSLISNGRLIADREISETEHEVTYRTDHSLPTYLMAFATGEFNHIESTSEGLPVSIWARQGARVDYDQLLEVTKKQIKHFKQLLGPYPWEKYALVLLPDFWGGIEHASITFACEDCSSHAQIHADISLMAHELAHQWFGDYVTVREWNDLWIKEGMATLLAADFMFSYRNNSNSPRLGGDSFWPSVGEPMMGPDLDYNSGPYSRAAWFLTQVRAILGENNFWSTLRELLSDHAYDSVSSDEVFSLFEKQSPILEKSRLRALALARSLPSLKIESSSENTWTMIVNDPDRVILSPLILRTWSGGNMMSLPIQANVNTTINIPPGSMLSLDPQDIHPRLEFFLDSEKLDPSRELLFLAAIPKNDTQVDVFSKSLGSSQDFLMGVERSWPLEPADFVNLYGSLTSETAKYLGLGMACRSAKSPGLDPLQAQLWVKNVNRWLIHPPIKGALRTIDLSVCKDLIAPEYLKSFYDLMITDPASPYLGDDLLFWLSRLPILPEHLGHWRNLALNGFPYRNRLLATQTLVKGSEQLEVSDENQPLLSQLHQIAREIIDSTTVRKVILVAEELLSKTERKP